MALEWERKHEMNGIFGWSWKHVTGIKLMHVHMPSIPPGRYSGIRNGRQIFEIVRKKETMEKFLSWRVYSKRYAFVFLQHEKHNFISSRYFIIAT